MLSLVLRTRVNVRELATSIPGPAILLINWNFYTHSHRVRGVFTRVSYNRVEVADDCTLYLGVKL